MRYYKVVQNTKERAKFVSYFAKKDLQAEYVVGATTYAAPDALNLGYGLCAFAYLDQAQHYIRYQVNDDLHCILVCEGPEPMHVPTWRLEGVTCLDELRKLARSEIVGEYWSSKTVMVPWLEVIEIYTPEEPT